MSTLWQQRDDRSWQSRLLPEDDVLEADDGLRFVRFKQGAQAGEAALLADLDTIVHVNGEPVLGGFRTLEHQDEILTAGRRFYYSAETAPVKTEFHLQGGGKPPSCPVCRRKLEEGQKAVQCPRCSRWLHEMPERLCWSYFPNCPICKHPTALTGEPVWRPEED
jgi:hypothetical protein